MESGKSKMPKLTFLDRDIFPLRVYATLRGRITTGYGGFGRYISEEFLQSFLKTSGASFKQNPPKMETELSVQIESYSAFLSSANAKTLQPMQSQALRNTVSLMENMLAIVKQERQVKRI